MKIESFLNVWKGTLLHVVEYFWIVVSVNAAILFLFRFEKFWRARQLD